MRSLQQNVYMHIIHCQKDALNQALLQLKAEFPGFFIARCDGANMQTKVSMFQEFADKFQFPSYFGHNWDAMEECLGDLEWIESPGYIAFIMDADLIFKKERKRLEKFRLLVTILDQCARDFNYGRYYEIDDIPKPFHIVWQIDEKEYIEVIKECSKGSVEES